MIAHLLDVYGYWILFFGTMLELVLFGVPTEVIMTYAGLLVYQGQLSWLWSVVAAWAGSCIGMSISYAIGKRLGYPFFEKYGKKVHFGPERLEKAAAWFGKYGNKVILIAFYIPGIRHVTGYFSGITKLPFRVYIRYAYPGALIWTGLFISLGKILGPKWEHYHKAASKYIVYACVIGSVVFLIYLAFKRYRGRLLDSAVQLRDHSLDVYHSLGRLRIVAVLGTIGLFTFTALVLGQIQDFFAQDFAEFDEIAAFIIHVLFDAAAYDWLNAFPLLASWPGVLAAGAFGALMVLSRKRDVGLQLFMIVWVVLTSEAIVRLLGLAFHRAGPVDAAVAPAGGPWTYPSLQTFLLTSVYGYAAYLAMRRLSVGWGRAAVFIVLIGLELLTGIGLVRQDVQYPSDVTGGYIFGGLWLVVSIMLLEVFRVLQIPADRE